MSVRDLEMVNRSQLLEIVDLLQRMNEICGYLDPNDSFYYKWMNIQERFGDILDDVSTVTVDAVWRFLDSADEIVKYFQDQYISNGLTLWSECDEILDIIYRIRESLIDEL